MDHWPTAKQWRCSSASRPARLCSVGGELGEPHPMGFLSPPITVLRHFPGKTGRADWAAPAAENKEGKVLGFLFAFCLFFNRYYTFLDLMLFTFVCIKIGVFFLEASISWVRWLLCTREAAGNFRALLMFQEGREDSKSMCQGKASDYYLSNLALLYSSLHIRTHECYY